MHAQSKFCGMTRAEAAVLISIAGILAALLTAVLPPMNGYGGISMRPICSANIRGIVQAMFEYAQNNEQSFPAVSPPGATFVNGLKPGPAAILSGRINPKTQAVMPMKGPGIGLIERGSPLACLWMLVAGGYVSPKSFICPADPVATKPSVEFASESRSGVRYYANFGMRGSGAFRSGRGESYSIAYPWIQGRDAPWWNANDADSYTPLICDMAPMQDPHASGNRARDVTQPLNNTYGPYIYNSGNHGGDGQNVGYGDDHVTWETNPYVGARQDNIFTYGKAGTAGGGTPIAPTLSAPSPKLSPKRPYDIVMVPTRNVATGRW